MMYTVIHAQYAIIQDYCLHVAPYMAAMILHELNYTSTHVETLRSCGAIGLFWHVL